MKLSETSSVKSPERGPELPDERIAPIRSSGISAYFFRNDLCRLLQSRTKVSISISCKPRRWYGQIDGAVELRCTSHSSGDSCNTQREFFSGIGEACGFDLLNLC